jgi:hypothetical protein
MSAKYYSLPHTDSSLANMESYPVIAGILNIESRKLGDTI